MGSFFFKLAVVIEWFSIISLGHTVLIPSVVFFLVIVPAFLVGMVLSGSPLAVCVISEIACFYTCKSVAVWAIEAPSYNIVKARVSQAI